MDSILKLFTLYCSIKKNQLVEIESVRHLVIDPSSLPKENKEDVLVYYDGHLDHLAADGIRLARIRTRPLKTKPIISEIEKQIFQPYTEINSQNDFIEICLEIITAQAGSKIIYVVENENCQMSKEIFQQTYNSSLLKIKSNIKAISSEYIDLTRDCGGTYLFVSDDKLSDSLVNLIDSSKHTCYLIQSASQSNTKSLTRFKSHTPILERNINDVKLVFYKKSINVPMEANFIEVPEGFLLGPKDETFAQEKSNFYFFKYKMLSEIPCILEASKSHLDIKNVRFAFVDQMSSTFFDPTQNLYQLQLKKDLKINVCHKGQWGTLKNVLMRVPDLTHDFLQARQTPLNKIRCNCINLKMVGINLQNLINPSVNDNFGILDYTGESRDQGDVMGLGTLTADNSLKVDPILVWKNPSHWSSQQAASVPYFYSLAYYILCIKRLPDHPDQIPLNRVFVHGGHTPFSQALIRVVLSLNVNIYTSCYTQQQKLQIIKCFPQIKVSNIFILEVDSKYVFDRIYESTNGQGIDIVVDCLDDDGFRESIIQCVAHYAQYFYFSHSDTKSDYSIGMNIFMRETSVIGINPDTLLAMSKENKHDLVKMLQNGIEKGHVVPLDTTFIGDFCTRKSAAETIVSLSRKQNEAKKALLKIDNANENKSTQRTDSSKVNNLKTKSFLVIGLHNLWLDITSWLAAKGADSILILNEWDTVPNHHKFRFKNLLDRYSNLKIRLLNFEQANSSEILDQTFQQIGGNLDTVFYIVPGMEKQLEMVNEALKTHCENSCLVCIGSSSSNGVTNARIKEGLKALSLILKRDNLGNRTVINVLDHWFAESSQKDVLMILDEHEPIEINEESKYPDILPRTAEELIYLSRETAEKPCFKEIPSASPPNRHSKELDPVFFFPGFRMSKLRNFISKFAYPSFMARYPSTIKSYDEVASEISKELLKFDLSMFNLVAEGWAGPLVLIVASLLEKEGKISQVILLDATPSTISKWSKAANNSKESLISRYMSSLSKGEEVTIRQLRSWKDRVVDIISNRENFSSMNEEIKQSTEILINRLQVLDTLKDLDVHIVSKVHIFTAKQNLIENNQEPIQLNKVSQLQCDYHVMDDTTVCNLLDSKNLMRDLRGLPLVEFKSSSRKQNISEVSTLEVTDFLKNYR